MQIQDRLKSFVLRKGRITSNQKRALLELKEKYILDNTKELDTHWLEAQTALDIGFGAGETTIHIAKSNPEINVLGAEVYLSGVGSVLSRAEEEGLENIRILNGDIVPFLEDKVPDESFNLILLFYPDPWPKRKHHKRRLIKRDFIDLINKKLKADSILYFKTDWTHYFQTVTKLFEDNEDWRLVEKQELDGYLIDLPQTSFEKKAINSGSVLHELILRKIN